MIAKQFCLYHDSFSQIQFKSYKKNKYNCDLDTPWSEYYCDNDEGDYVYQYYINQ